MSTYQNLLNESMSAKRRQEDFQQPSNKRSALEELHVGDDVDTGPLNHGCDTTTTLLGQPLFPIEFVDSLSNTYQGFDSSAFAEPVTTVSYDGMSSGVCNLLMAEQPDRVIRQHFPETPQEQLARNTTSLSPTIPTSDVSPELVLYPPGHVFAA